MALITCPECSKQISSEAAVCPHCGISKEKRQLMPKKDSYVGLLVVILLSVLFIGPCIFNTGKQSSLGTVSGLLSSDFTIKISGTPNLKYTGSYMVVSLDGQSKSTSVDGRVPNEYVVSGSMVSVAFQKHEEVGKLRVDILRNGDVVSGSETTAAYGMVSVASR